VRRYLPRWPPPLAALAPPDLSGKGCKIGGASGTTSYWQEPTNYQVYWSDSDSPDTFWPPGTQTSCGYGIYLPGGGLTPTPDSSGNVFHYTYILPQFLYAVSAFVSVGVAIDPNFAKNWGQTVITQLSCFLQTVHDYILSQGFTQFSPLFDPDVPFWDGTSLNTALAGYIQLASNLASNKIHGYFSTSGISPHLVRRPARSLLPA
jgi:hypothetical protein